jgi:hypothetical protein
MITPVAELIIWRQVINGYVIGTIHNSNDAEFPNGKRSTWQFQHIIHYPALTGHWEDHLLLQWWDGKYLKAEHKHMEKIIKPTGLL